MSVVVPSAFVRSPISRVMLMSLIYQRVGKEEKPIRNTKSVRRGNARSYQDKEEQIAKSLGGWPVTLPYSNEVVHGPHETDVDHVVPIMEALESGGNAWNKQAWRQFLSDPANLMLAIPRVNRYDKGAKGVEDWVPEHHRVWYVSDYSLVKISHGLLFDPAEVLVIENILLGD